MSGRFILSFVVTTLVGFLAACTPGPLVPADLSATISVTRMITPMATAEPLSTPPADTQQLPTYLLSTDPPAGGSTPRRLLDESQVCVRFDTAGLLEQGEQLTDAQVIERISLLVNGEQAEGLNSFTASYVLDDAGNVKATGNGLYNACWHVELRTKAHQAEFQFRQTSGTIQSYHWQFTVVPPTPIPTPTPMPTVLPLPLTGPLPTAEPLPGPIYDVYPPPAAVLPLRAEAGMTTPEPVYKKRICVGVSSTPTSVWLERVPFNNLTLNGTPLGNVEMFRVTIEYSIAGDVEDTSQFGGSAGGVELCWEPVVLVAGTYEAVFQIEGTSGRLLQYRWFFTLTEP
jgi:hypothetical protein